MSRCSTIIRAAVILAATLTAAQSPGQQIYGTPGAPSATMSIPGDQLPPPPQKFGGQIGQDAFKSKPYWPARIVPPKGAPNILLIMTDDVGFGAPLGGTMRAGQ